VKWQCVSLDRCHCWRIANRGAVAGLVPRLLSGLITGQTVADLASRTADGRLLCKPCTVALVGVGRKNWMAPAHGRKSLRRVMRRYYSDTKNHQRCLRVARTPYLARNPLHTYRAVCSGWPFWLVTMALQTPLRTPAGRLCHSDRWLLVASRSLPRLVRRYFLLFLSAACEPPGILLFIAAGPIPASLDGFLVAFGRQGFAFWRRQVVTRLSIVRLKGYKTQNPARPLPFSGPFRIVAAPVVGKMIVVGGRAVPLRLLLATTQSTRAATDC